MKFLRNLVFGKSRNDEQIPAAAPAPIRTEAQVDSLDRVRRSGTEAEAPAKAAGAAPKKPTTDKSTTDLLRAVASKAGDAGGSNAPGIWDMDSSIPSAEELLKRASAAPSKGKGRRVKTRLVGFDTSDGGVVDLFKEDAAKPAETPETPEVETGNAAAPAIPMFPVGWILVVDGPGRGASYPLMSGMSQIGRGVDQAVRLDFGDTAISRSGHAAIVYDDEAKTFLLGQGGKSNIVRLNGTPVIQNEDLKDGDKIKVGETTLQLKTLCGEDFDWKVEDDGEEDEDDVAIA